MFYENYINNKNVKNIRNKFPYFKGLNADKDKSLIGLEYTPLSYNFDFSDGLLKDGLGLESLKFKYSTISGEGYKEIDALPDASFVKGMWLFNSWSDQFNVYRSFLVMYNSYGDFYYNMLHDDRTEVVKMEGLNFTEKPIITSYKIDGVDTLILVSQKDGMYTWQYPSTVKKIENAPAISSMCVYNDRLFVTTYGEKRKIWYSDDLNPVNFGIDNSSAGYIDLNDEFGKCNKVIWFKGSLYVIRDFNITKIVASYDNPHDYKLSQLYVSNGKIFENTVCICGDKIMFLTSDGLYSFDGNKSSRIETNINCMFEDVDNSSSVGGYSNGYYYLACNLNYDKEYITETNIDEHKFTNNALIRINISTKELTIMRGHDVEDLFVINHLLKNEVCVLVREYGGQYTTGIINSSGCHYNKVNNKVWYSASTDFGMPDKVKLVKEITLSTSQDIMLEVCTEKCNKTIIVSGKDGYQTIKVNVKGKDISINFISKKSNNCISNPMLLVSYM